MQVIQEASQTIMKILGKTKLENTPLRWMTYVVPHTVEDGILLYHTLTCELLLVSQEEYDNPDAVSGLHEKWFLVPSELDDKKCADQVRFVLKNVEKRNNSITNFVVFTTTDCNARCFYCFEKGCSRINMSEETAYKAVEYMVKHSGGNKIFIRWFGGEPLLNQRVINLITKELTKRGAKYTSSMTSNGYLFCEETIQKAAKEWNLKSVLITLDGTEKIYNRSKAYIYKDCESSYKVVMENITNLLDAGIKVQLRLNLDYYNAEDMLLLADELYARFGGRKGIFAYGIALYEIAGRNIHIRPEEERHFVYEKLTQLRKKLEKYGFVKTKPLQCSLRTHACMADGKNTRTILPGGELGVCEHYTDDHFVGRLDEEFLDPVMLGVFHEYQNAMEECADCIHYPNCYRPKKCSVVANCYPENREEFHQEYQDSMKAGYNVWKNSEKVNEQKLNQMCE